MNRLGATEVQTLVKPWNPKVYAYVSSGGMYLVPPSGPLVEGGAVKLDNKQLANENHARNLGLNWCSFRPQYIYGPKTNKRDYIDWFLDRITRDLPFPLPQDGSLFTTLTNSEDVAGMMASVVGKESEANGQIFNCAGDELLSHIEVVKVICEALGKDSRDVLSKVVFYDPAALNFGCNVSSIFRFSMVLCFSLSPKSFGIAGILSCTSFRCTRPLSLQRLSCAHKPTDNSSLVLFYVDMGAICILTRNASGRNT